MNLPGEPTAAVTTDPQKETGDPSKPRRIALFLPDLRGGGAERVMLNVASALSERGCSVDVVLAQKQGEYLEHVPETLRIVDLGVGRTLECIMPLAGYLKRERPDVLIGALSHANGIALLSRSISRTRIPVVISLHNTMSVETANERGLRQKALRWLTRALSPGADAIIAVSNGVADDYAKLVGIDRARIQVIYNPVVSPAMLEKSRQPVDHPWMQPDQPPVILGVGRLNPQKDFHNLLRAFAILKKTRQARLIILGQGEERAGLEALVEELKIGDDVALPGFADNPFAYMANAAVFALSSQFEGLPTVLIEAMACGCQVVSTDCPSGPREIFEAAGAGTLVPVGDPAALAEAIGKCLDAGRPDLPPATWDRYTLPVAADQYLDVIQQAIENPHAAA